MKMVMLLQLLLLVVIWVLAKKVVIRTEGCDDRR